MKIECPKCKFTSDVPDDKIPENGVSVTCPECKTKFQVSRLTAPTPMPTPTITLKCPNCGTEQENSNDCISCGIVFSKYIAVQKKKAALTPPSLLKTEALKQQELNAVKSDSKYLKIIIALLCCIIVGGAIFFFSSDKKPSESTYHVVNSSQPSSPQKTSIKIPPSAVVAYKALKKVEARTGVGVSRRDYPEVIAEAKVAVNLFLESPESQSIPELKQSLEKVMKHYTDAQGLWDVNISTPGLNADFRDYWKWAAEELKKISVMMGNIP